LRACDNRLCENCYQDNERKLAALKKASNGVLNGLTSDSMLNGYTSIAGDATCTRSGEDCCVPNCKLLKCENLPKGEICLKTFHGQCPGFDDLTTQTLLTIIRKVGWVCSICQ
jgi:hypothetical protein